MLVLLARQWCATPEDVVQESFLKLSEASPVPENPAAWLYRVVRHAAISAGRSERRRVKREQQVRADWFVHDPSVQLDAQQAVQALEQLVPEERDIILAHLWGGLTFEEIGTMMSSSSSTTHRLFTKGLHSLRQLLGEVHVP